MKNTEIENAIVDFYEGRMQSAKIKAGLIHDIISNNSEDDIIKKFNDIAKDHKMSTNALKQVLDNYYEYKNAAYGISREEFIDNFLMEAKKQVEKDIAAGKISGDTIPKNIKVRFQEMNYDEVSKIEQIKKSLKDGFKKMKLDGGNIAIAYGFAMLGAPMLSILPICMIMDNHSFEDQMFVMLSAILAVFLSTTVLLHMSQILNSIKTFIESYKDENRKNELVYKYYAILSGLAQKDERFKGLQDEFVANYPNLISEDNIVGGRAL